MNEQFAVTPPAGAVTQNVTLYGTADLSPSCNYDSTGLASQTTNDWATLDQKLALNAYGCTPVRRHAGLRLTLLP